MLKVGQFLKFLSENNPQATPARLTLFNYLSHFHSENDSFHSEDLEAFFAHLMDYAHWQQNKTQLSGEIRQLLENFAQTQPGVLHGFDDVKWPHETQVIEIESMADLTDAVQAYLKFHLTNGEKFRLALDQNKKLIAIILNPDQSLTLRQFDKKFILRHGQLEPLRKNLSLHYTSSLEMDATKTQRLEVAPFVIAQFKVSEEGMEGVLVRGYVAQKFFDLKGTSLEIYPKLFYSVKRLEQFFVDRQTDPFYQETVAALENCTHLVKIGDPEAIQDSMDTMAKAQNALEYVFTGDKLLSLLIRDLQHTLTTRKSGPAVGAAPKTESRRPMSEGMRPNYEAEESCLPTNSSPSRTNHHQESQDLTN